MRIAATGILYGLSRSACATESIAGGIAVQMSILSKLADRLILCPSTNPIDPGDKERVVVPSPRGHVEAYIESVPGDKSQSPTDLLVLKFPGTAGRAERAGVHPAEIWTRFASEIWTVNHHGYGQSSGPPTLQSFPEVCDAVYRFARNQCSDRQIVVTGNSLGCISALYLAARHSVAGVLLRNPVPIHELIRQRPRYALWNFGLSRFIAEQVPSALNAIENAIKSQAPCLFIQSELDRVVPAKYQDQIIDNYSGDCTKFVSLGTDHHEPIPEYQSQIYVDSVKWLEQKMVS